MRRLFCLLILLAGALSARPAAAAESIYVDLSSHLIEIGSRFTGASVIMFGTTSSPGDVVVVIRGPSKPVVVRLKEQSAGFWFNSDSVVFRDAPQFYAIAASAPIEQILPDAIRTERQIGVKKIALKPDEAVELATLEAFQDAFVRERIRRALYPHEVGVVSFIDAKLFRTSVNFPAEVPTGSYSAEVLFVKNGEVVATRSTPLVIAKTGVAAQLFAFAHRDSYAYAAIAVAAALLAGWLGYVLFRKV